MKKQWSLSQEALDNLLKWLDPDRERAGHKYEEIRNNLISIFARRGCPFAEELADETINRVTRKAYEIAQSYTGDPGLYFYGVAQNVYKEYVKKKPAPVPIPPPDPAEEKERRLNCLEHCLSRLDVQSHDLILEYYFDEKRRKINHRKGLAEQLGVKINALRMRAHRIKVTLHQCVSDCLVQN